jgi:hypothetical protein
MATGTVQFQSGTIVSPPPGLAVMADAVNDTDHGAGTAQYIKIMDGATGGTIKAGVSALGLAVVGTAQMHGTGQALGTFQPLAGSVHLASGTVQVLGSVQVVGTTQTKDVRTVANPFGTRIAANTSASVLLPSNASRLGASFYVEMGSALFLKLGSSPGTFDYSVQVNAGALYEVPFGYSGTVSGIWAFASGTVQITENT